MDLTYTTTGMLLGALAGVLSSIAAILLLDAPSFIPLVGLAGGVAIGATLGAPLDERDTGPGGPEVTGGR